MLHLSQIRTLAGCHWVFVFLLVMLLAPETLSAALVASTATSLDAGGKRVTSSRYTIDGSVSSLGGISTASSPSVIVRDGYAGQLYELQSIIISASPTNVIATGTSQLAVTGVLNDGTFLPIAATNVIWSVFSGPLIGVTANGKVISTNVSQSTSATVSAACQGVSATLALTVSSFSILSLSKADSFPVSGWSVSYASSSNCLYSLYYSTDLASGYWTPVPFQTNIPGSGGVDSLSDTNISSAQRFYRIGVAVP